MPQFDPIVNLDRAFFKTLARSAQDAKGRLTKWQGAMEKVNKEALRYLQEQAGDVLQERIRATGRPQDHNSGRLARAIADPANHEANKYRIRFMIDEIVRPKVPYYGAIEFGSNYWPESGRTLLFAFFGGPFDAKSGSFGNANRGGGYMVGPREYRKRGLSDPVHRVRIRRPVPAYHYGGVAEERLMAGPFDELILKHLGPETKDIGGNLSKVPGQRSGSRPSSRKNSKG